MTQAECLLAYQALQGKLFAPFSYRAGTAFRANNCGTIDESVG